MKRRKFLVSSLGLVLAVSCPVFANQTSKNIRAFAITKIFGDGIKLVAIALECEKILTLKDIKKDDFSVENRTISDVFVSDEIGLKKQEKGKFIILLLSLEDKNLSLSKMILMSNSTIKANKTSKKPWVAGDKPASNLVFEEPKAKITYQGISYNSDSVKNLVADEFLQLVFQDKTTNKTLRYNLYIPKNAKDKKLPLVLFMHDAGTTSEYHKATLYQGLGAIVWASPKEQEKRPCFVLAPQYDEIIVDDNSNASSMLETTINLINELVNKYNIDTKRIYATGQSGGCMMSIAMNIKYPNLFAASFLVAGQWDYKLVKPLANKKLFILVSADDLGAFPGQNLITKQLEKEGAKISRDIWDGRWGDSEYRFAFDKIISNNNPINYVVFKKDSVFLEGDSKQGASGHRNTWRIAYSIEPIREWIFEQIND